MNIKLLVGCVAFAALGLTSCSDEFLQEKKDHNLVSTIIYDDYEGAEARVNDIYAWSLHNSSYSLDYKRKSLNYGKEDAMTRSTEEYAKFSDWVNPLYNMNIVNYEGKSLSGDYDYFHGQSNNVQAQVYGRIRNINDVIAGIAAGTLPQADKDKLLGQVHFWRAWAYYQLVKWYGGVPIITEVLPPVEGNSVPRSTTKETIEFICDELDLAAQLLEAETGAGGWQDTSDWGRVTTGTALALKGRVLNLWASPLFNRANDITRWEAAYNFISESVAKIEACGYGLVDGSSNTAQGWADIFSRTDRNPEAVLVQLYNAYDRDDKAYENVAMSSDWEQTIRPSNTGGGGGLQPSQMIIDLFPMKDGKLPANAPNFTTLGTSSIAYDTACPWMNRDPRFYRTFAFPGVRWAMSGNPASYDGDNWNGSEYECWSYVWYLKEDASKIDAFRSSSSHGPDGNSKAKGFYVRKRSCDADASQDNYVYNGEFLSGAPIIELRFTEVLLNLAEAAAGANKLDVAVQQLRRIRERVGYSGDCGISSSMTQGQTMAAVLYERLIEFAYEGRRFEDMRRWLLFDGGATAVADAPSTWVPSGYNGNTCSWLGVKPMNGMRRNYYEFHVTYDAGLGAGIGLNQVDGDPLTNADVVAKSVNADATTTPIVRPAAIDFRENGETLDAKFAALKEFYTNYLACKVYSGDEYEQETDVDYGMLWRPHYYLMGIRNLQDNIGFEQTIGWDDNVNNRAGAFDPLAE